MKPLKNFSKVHVSVIAALACAVGLFAASSGYAVGKTAKAAKALPVKAAAKSAAKDVKAATTMKVYYFHGSVRCVTCRKIEQYTKEAVEQSFSSGTYAGKVLFIPVNVEENANEHFVEQYKLVAKSVILQPEQGGKPGQWENLDRIWVYSGDRDKFLAYVKGSVLKLLEGR